MISTSCQSWFEVALKRILLHVCADASVAQAIEDDYSQSEGELQDAEEKPDPDIKLGSKLIYSATALHLCIPC